MIEDNKLRIENDEQYDFYKELLEVLENKLANDFARFESIRVEVKRYESEKEMEEWR